MPSLAAGVQPDYDNSITFDQYIGLYTRPSMNAVFIAYRESPEITRFDLDASGRLVQGSTISFAHLGLTHTANNPERNPILSDTKAYVIRTAARQIAVWNPSEMIVTGAIDLTEALTLEGTPEGYRPVDGKDLIHLENGRVLLQIFWQDADGVQFAPVSRVVIDTRDDRVIAVHDDSRITMNWSSSIAQDGTIYLSPAILSTLAHDVFGSGYGSPASTVRIIPPGATFDEGYEVDLRQLTGGHAAGAFQIVGDDLA